MINAFLGNKTFNRVLLLCDVNTKNKFLVMVARAYSSAQTP